MSEPTGNKAASIAMRIGAIASITALFVWAFFALAGRWDWLAGWWYLALLIATETIRDLAVVRANPGLLTRRGRFGSGTALWDYWCLAGFGLCFLATLVVAALDSGRFSWSTMPWWSAWLGAVLLTVGQLFLTWAMVANPFFEKTVRLQEEHGQQVVDSGPYRLVRHPGYLGTITGLVLGTPLLLGSWWAFVPASAGVATLVVRTLLEDRYLYLHLPNYADYARRVPYRLLPGLC